MNAIAILSFMAAWMTIENTMSEMDRSIRFTRFEDQLGISVLVLSIVLSVFISIQFRNSLERIDLNLDLKEKLGYYSNCFTQHIFKFLIGAMIISVLYFFFTSQILIAAFAIILVMMTINRLTYPRIARQLKLNKKEREEFFKTS